MQKWPVSIHKDLFLTALKTSFHFKALYVDVFFYSSHLPHLIELSFQNSECFNALLMFLPIQLLKHCCLWALLNLTRWTLWTEKPLQKSQFCSFAKICQKMWIDKAQVCQLVLNEANKETRLQHLLQVKKNIPLSNSIESNTGSFASTTCQEIVSEDLSLDLVNPFINIISQIKMFPIPRR